MKRPLILSTLVSLQLIGAFIIQLYVIRIVGIGDETDIYIAAQAFPAVIISILSAMLQSVWLPRLSPVSNDLKLFKELQSIALGQSILLSIVFIIAIGVSAPLWVKVIFAQFSESQLNEVIAYTFVILASLFFSIQSGVLVVVFRSVERFVLVEIVGFITIIFSLLLLYFTLPGNGIEAAIWVIFVRSVVMYVMQMMILGWPKISIIKALKYSEGWISMRPILFGSAITKTSPLVDRYWSAQAPVGVTIFGLARTGVNALVVLIERVVCVPIIPSFSKLIEQNKISEVRSLYKSGIHRVLLIVLLVTAMFVLFQTSFIDVVSFFLNVNAATAEDIWLLCFILMGYLFSASAGVLVVSMFHALGDTQTQVKVGIISFVFSLIVKAGGYILFSLPGLVAAISIHFTANLLIMNYILNNKMNRLQRKRESF